MLIGNFKWKGSAKSPILVIDADKLDKAMWMLWFMNSYDASNVDVDENRPNIDVDELATVTLMNCWQVAQIAPLPIARAAESHSYSTIPTSYYTSYPT